MKRFVEGVDRSQGTWLDMADPPRSDDGREKNAVTLATGKRYKVLYLDCI